MASSLTIRAYSSYLLRAPVRRAHRVLEQRDRLRVPHAALAVAAPRVDAADRQEILVAGGTPERGRASRARATSSPMPMRDAVPVKCRSISPSPARPRRSARRSRTASWRSPSSQIVPSSPLPIALTMLCCAISILPALDAGDAPRPRGRRPSRAAGRADRAAAVADQRRGSGGPRAARPTRARAFARRRVPARTRWWCTAATASSEGCRRGRPLTRRSDRMRMFAPYAIAAYASSQISAIRFVGPSGALGHRPRDVDAAPRRSRGRRGAASRARRCAGSAGPSRAGGVLGRLGEQARLGADPRPEAHHDLLADRVGGFVTWAKSCLK